VRRELLLGCGASKDKRLKSDTPWVNLTTLDINPDHKPDVLWDLEKLPYPFMNDTFDEIHAYEVLEHIGQQGDYRTFFAQFSDLWRIMKPDGMLYATCPSWNSLWSFGDPSHKRVINEGTLAFVSQKQYQREVGHSPMSDFRNIYKADFEVKGCEHKNDTFIFVLQAIKPSRYYT